MARFGKGDRVVCTLNDSGRQGTVRSEIATPAMAADKSGPWYMVHWDAVPGLTAAQGAPTEECDLARVR